MSAPIIELVGIGKTYPGVRALKGVSLSVAPGEVVGLIGENGAGKSTLMKVLGGVVEPSEGTIRLGGRDHGSLTVPQSLGAGIAFVHQELNLFDNLDAAGNVFIGREPTYFGPLRLIDRRTLRAKVAPLLARLGCDFRADTSVADLSIAQCQMLEIVKALSLDARVIIMDEPTSSLTLTETNRLLDVVADLKRSGVAVVFITHRLSEIERCADRVVVLRDGAVVGELPRAEIRHETMIRMMIGRDLKSLYTPPARPKGEAVIELVGLATPAYPGRPVDLPLHAGEILGLGGLVGAGRTELARVVFGLDRPATGTLRMGGRDLVLGSPKDAIRHGIYLAPEDRKAAGVILEDPIRENVSLANLPAFARFGLVRTGAERAAAELQRKALHIKAPDVEVRTGALSGGNQQKVVLGKWLSMDPKVMIFDEPTRGIDVGSKAEIYTLMRALADRGVAILMISSDMEEVIGVSDRVAVMHEGAITGVLDRHDLSEAAVMRLAVGTTMH